MPQRIPILVSACLCGFACRYDGRAAPAAFFTDPARSVLVLPVCPEVLGGLPVPRDPCEIIHGRVRTQKGVDHTRAFTLGAQKALSLAAAVGVRVAILKDNSPSCGSTWVYDGAFSGVLVPGEGVTAALLRRSGIKVLNENAKSILRLLCPGSKNSMTVDQS